MKMRKGFTLVELLIVIVIIGILAAAMLLSSTSATASATASNVVTELRGLKAAASMFFADSMDEIMGVSATPLTQGHGGISLYLARYMDNSHKVKADANFLFAHDGNQAAWYVGYNLAAMSTQVLDKLEGRAKTTGLFNGTATGPSGVATGSTFTKAGGSYIWMVAR